MIYKVTLNGKIYEVEVNESEAVLTSVMDAPTAAASPVAPAAPAAPAAAAPTAPAQTASGQTVLAPMPGTILDVKVANGQAVKKGDVMFILEAMKMENDVVAPEDGTVKQILVQKGAQVDSNQTLAVI